MWIWELRMEGETPLQRWIWEGEEKRNKNNTNTWGLTQEIINVTLITWQRVDENEATRERCESSVCNDEHVVITYIHSTVPCLSHSCSCFQSLGGWKFHSEKGGRKLEEEHTISEHTSIGGNSRKHYDVISIHWNISKVTDTLSLLHCFYTQKKGCF